ncbi:MAG: DMT family transporter, partial [Bacteroidota bacterium]
GFFETVLASETMQIAMIYVSVLALFGTAIAKVLFNKLVQVASPVFAASVTYTMPLIAVLWGLWDGEELSSYQFLGGMAILLGVYLANKSNGNKKAPRNRGAS